MHSRFKPLGALHFVLESAIDFLACGVAFGRRKKRPLAYPDPLQRSPWGVMREFLRKPGILGRASVMGFNTLASMVYFPPWLNLHRRKKMCIDEHGLEIIHIIASPQQPHHTDTMTSYKELLKQREALDQQISEARRSELADAISRARSLVAEFGLSAQDVFPAGRGAGKAGRSSTAGTKVAPKYRNPATGETWTGRGKAPKWIQNESREKFAI